MDVAKPQAMNEENQTPELECSTVNTPSPRAFSYGGRTCCVPNCNNNSRRKPELSYHRMPKEPKLRKTWIKLLKTKGLCNPDANHYVCSAHFPGGKKTYTNNIPTIFTLDTNLPTKRRNILGVAADSNTNPEPSTSLSYSLANTTCVGTDTKSTEENSAEEISTTNSVVIEETNQRDTNSTSTENINIQAKLQDLQAKYDTLQQKYDNNMAAMQQKLFRLERFVGSDHDFRFYTGFPDYVTFKVFFDYFTPACYHLIYYGSTTTEITSETQKKRGKARSLSPEQELFMVLVRLRCGLLIEDVAHRFDLSPSHVSRINITWITFLSQQLRFLPIWPTRKFVDDNMPECFKRTFPETRVIIDCTEIYIETPSSCRSQSATFSSYKNNNTAKGLLGISPCGFPSFVSHLYAGRTSDKKLTKDCGILSLLEPGDQLMADRGFDIEDDMPEGVTLNIPAFMDKKEQLDKEDEIMTRKIASVRVHVERAISRIKNFRILHQTFSLKSAQQLDEIWTICSYISLFMPPLINETQ